MIRRLFVHSRLGELPAGVRFIAYLLLGAWTVVVLFPLYWMAITSFKLPIDVSNGPAYLPFVDFKPSLDAWHYIFVDLGPDTYRPYVNSLVIATCSTAASVFLGSMAAYALARIEYRPPVAAVGVGVLILAVIVGVTGWAGVDLSVAVTAGLALFFLLLRPIIRRARRRFGNDDILFWIISQRILPPVVTVIPIYLMFKSVGLLDTRLALIITYATANVPIVVWLMFDFFAAVPKEVEESAQIDGATRFAILFGIVMPLVAPGIVATALLVLILSWNEYLFALFLSTANAQTLPLLVAAQNATRGPQWWNMSVLILIMIFPVMVLTLTLQRFIVKGILVGAVKG
ncbi:carbohydrate ABC transporter permease [Paraburkholderia gardini]|jgi:multiple sugar transport system permease protein|uniref:Maltose/maltodextrin transport system permease protein MalG n=1 Tax=Paraburkholderia gardini TaxID=2823469 RepID=A0ABN7QFU2_9BURK|nr:carbohydrate ABC transporter permease [Paraburkholderia gardini]CAG4889025.1 Diacetylchitobiose uptake system permease protein DasC [Paraburkholderia gardini]CAG4896602.1 Diacetylchitobiose uptake system permease protein DasC [Paraburkholderia gardini]